MSIQLELPEELPRIAADLPGTGGVIKQQPADFVVEEIPAYEPCGEGEHLFLWVEKEKLSADALTRQIARQLEISPREVGCAGLKDTVAVTRQYISVPAKVEEKVAQIDDDKIRVLRAERHGNKLKTGHLRGNRFRVMLRDVHPDAPARAGSIVARLQSQGIPNFFGAQRFGRGGETLQIGLEILESGRSTALARAGRGRKGFLKRLALSSVQSALFNRCLMERMTDNLLHRTLEGDAMQVVESGGVFVSDDPANDQTRFDSREIVPTGPLFGPKMREPEKEAAQREMSLLNAAGLTPETFVGHGKIMRGARRANLIWLEELEIKESHDGLELSFILPRGSYATVLLGEITGGAATVDAGS